MNQLVIVDNIYVSPELLTERFVCDLSKCKGGCCVDGDAGAPLADNELEQLEKVYPVIKKYLTPEAIQEIETTGIYTRDDEFDWVTPDIDGGVCVYAYTDEQNIVKCAIEKAYNNGEVDWKKPISCHLFPIRVGKVGVFEALKYEPREEKHLCLPACKLGDKLKIPVYKFLKEPIIRAYGKSFYEAVDEIAKNMIK